MYLTSMAAAFPFHSQFAFDVQIDPLGQFVQIELGCSLLGSFGLFREVGGGAACYRFARGWAPLERAAGGGLGSRERQGVSL